MFIKFYFFLALLFLLSSCSTKVEKKKFVSPKEQVDLDHISPLAQFVIKEDSLDLFESFSNFTEPQKKPHTKLEQAKEKSQPTLIYFVQVGLTDSYDEISYLKVQVSNLFPYEKVKIEYDTPFYRVIIGPFKSRSEANEIFSILERKNFSSLRIRTETSK